MNIIIYCRRESTESIKNIQGLVRCTINQSNETTGLCIINLTIKEDKYKTFICEIFDLFEDFTITRDNGETTIDLIGS